MVGGFVRASRCPNGPAHVNVPHDGWDPVMHGDDREVAAHGLWSQLDAVVVGGARGVWA